VTVRLMGDGELSRLEVLRDDLPGSAPLLNRATAGRCATLRLRVRPAVRPQLSTSDISCTDTPRPNPVWKHKIEPLVTDALAPAAGRGAAGGADPGDPGGGAQDQGTGDP
jgi:hypothetical protein